MEPTLSVTEPQDSPVIVPDKKGIAKGKEEVLTSLLVNYDCKKDGLYAVGKLFMKNIGNRNTSSSSIDTSVYLQPGLQEMSVEDLDVVRSYFNPEKFDRCVTVFQPQKSRRVLDGSLEDYTISDASQILKFCENSEQLETLARGVSNRDYLKLIEGKRRIIVEMQRRKQETQRIEVATEVAPLVQNQFIGLEY